MSGAAPSESYVRYEEDPANPGWMTWELRDPALFNAVLGPMLVRAEPGGGARVRIVPTRAHTNLAGNVHGAAIMSLIDIAMFAGARALGIIDAGAAVTLDCATQFLAPGRPDEPLDAVVEVLRETGRLIFVRGLIEQGSTRIAAFSGTLRKAPSRP